ncbi:MAG: hypothetical protein V1784_03500 [bacterium]
MKKGTKPQGQAQVEALDSLTDFHYISAIPQTALVHRGKMLLDRIYQRTVFWGVGLAAAAMLSYEILLTRFLSFISWYFLAFLAISLAMLGGTAGAIYVYLKPELFNRDRYFSSLARAGIAAAFSIFAVAVVLCIVPFTLDVSATSVFVILTHIACSSLPFFFLGIFVAASLTRSQLDISKVYASDLAGAAFGSLLAVLILGPFEIVGAMFLTGALCAFVAWLCAGQAKMPRFARTSLWILWILVVGALLNQSSYAGLRPWFLKGEAEPANRIFEERWNCFATLTVSKPVVKPAHLWAPAKDAPQPLLEEMFMWIDGAGGSPVMRVNNPQELDFLRYDATSLAYYLRPKGTAVVIGMGGGRDVMAALHFGHSHVTGIEINPAVERLHRGKLRGFSGLATRPDVTMVTADGRAYLASHPQKCDVLQISLLDTWAATGVGAYSLTPNGVFTREAWKILLRQLAPNGILTVTRWYSTQEIEETGRLIALSVQSLLDEDSREPRASIILVGRGSLATLLLKREPFTADELKLVEEVCSLRGYDILILPGREVFDRRMEAILSAKTESELDYATRPSQLLNLRYPTDDRPFFFNMLHVTPAGLFEFLDSMIQYLERGSQGIIAGNMVATGTLIVLIFITTLFAIATVFLPLRFRGEKIRLRASLGWGLLYFALIGLGFMLAEMALLQRLSVTLGNPPVALGVVLPALILSTGFGSLLSGRLHLERKPACFLFPILIVAAILLATLLLPILSHLIESQTTLTKAIVSGLFVAILSLPLGFAFPTGMKLAERTIPDATPWLWGINGIFGVIASGLSVMLSIGYGISATLIIAAILYALLPIAAVPLAKDIR